MKALQLKGIHLKESDFIIKNGKAIVPSNHPGMLLIYADYCPHCHVFIPTFNKIQTIVGDKFPMMSIEHSLISSSLNKALDFSGYPTIKFFDQQGNLIKDYNGERTEADILMYICKIYNFCVNRL